MSKYINAEVFKAKIMNYGRIYEGDRIPVPFYKEHCGKMFTELLRWVCEEVDDAFPADVAEVVRCKDCKYREKEQPGMVYCPNTVGGWVDEDWFCAGGEKE